MNVQNLSAPPAVPAVPAQPALPALPAPSAAPTAAGASVAGPSGSSAADVYIAFRAQRRELGRQLESLEEQRSELASRLQEEPAMSAADRKGVEQRLGEIDQRIATVDKQIAAADADVARAVAVPGATIEPPAPPRTGPPEEAFALGGLFIMVVFFPIAFAYARRIWRRTAKVVTAFPSELAERLNRLEQSTDAIAVEVERIGEGQRFMTRLFTENGAARALGASAEDPLDVTRVQEAVPVRR